MTDNYDVTVNKIGEYSIFNITPKNTLVETKRIRYFFTVDNSGSMGNYTVLLTNIIVSGLLDNFSNQNNNQISLLPSSLIEFKEHASILSQNIRSSKDLKSIRFTDQGQTNITWGVETTCDEIIRANRADNDCHNIFVFLSDGQHNQGPKPESFASYTKKFLDRNIKLSVIIIGISNSDNKIGMKIKTELETLELVDLQNIYYVSNHSDMTKTLNDLTAQLNSSLVTSHSVNITLPNANDVFFGDERIIKKSFTNSLTFLAKTSSNIININGVAVTAVESTVTLQNLESVFGYYIPQFTRIRLTHGLKHITDGLKGLEELITLFDQVQTNLNSTQNVTVNDIGKIKLKPSQRLELLKRSKGFVSQTSELRNIINSMKINITNDSRSQANYLTGMTNKFSTKAVSRAGTIDKTLDQVLLELKHSQADLLKSIELDKQNYLKNNNVCQSFVSLMSVFEQIEEWDYNLTINNIYELLIAYSMCGYPIKFYTSNACQMDPFQTVCTFIDPTMIDSGTVALYNQLGNKLETFDKKEITDVLILVDPLCPNTCLTAMRTNVYQYLSSVTLCRDLYMYNSQMTFAFHAHSLLASLKNKDLHKWNIDLAIRIIYSIKKFGVGSKYKELFNRWWNEWNGITQSAEDNCNHPIQLPILLALDNNRTNSTLKSVPFKNLISEYMARHFKMILRSGVADKTDSATKLKATEDLCEYFGINSTNSPKPSDDILLPEPPLDMTKEKCQRWANVNPTSKLHQKYPDLKQYLDNLLLPLIRSFELASVISNLDNFTESLEEVGGVPEILINNCLDRLNQFDSVRSYIDLIDTDGSDDNIYINLFCQAYYYHFSSDREKLFDIQDPVSLEDIIVKLRLSVYFEACKIKTEKWQQIIGNVSYVDACNADINQFTNMLGHHVHGMCKQQFWGFVEAAKHDKQKKDIFISKSNGTVGVCFERRNKMLNT